MLQRPLHAEHRGLQRGVGVENAGEAELFHLARWSARASCRR